MTQELIANKLGVHRKGVTEAAGQLQHDGLIHYKRGKIHRARPSRSGVLGDEGIIGSSLIPGVDVSPLRPVVQGAGQALRMNAAPFRR